MKCKECGQENDNDVAFCGKCGGPTTSDENKIKCAYCNVKISNKLEYCTNCGKPTSSIMTDDKKRNRKDDNDNDDDDEGGIIGTIGDIVGKLFC